MKKTITMGAMILTTALTEVEAQTTTWAIDPSHTKVGFSVTHMMVAETEGKFKMYDGKVTSSKEDFTDAQIEFSIDVASINTDDEKRDGHLKSPDFFDVEKFPKMKFKSKSFKKVADKKYKLSGELTIKDVTKAVEFDVIYNGTAQNPWTKAIVAGFKLDGTINRVDYGLKWNAALEAGGVIVGENVKIKCDVELNKK
ncbi:MAG: YceI family protein [Bacteroidetes bacterium]|nr:YceI family protein [Bacteroidota bacterium]